MGLRLEIGVAEQTFDDAFEKPNSTRLTVPMQRVLHA